MVFKSLYKAAFLIIYFSEFLESNCASTPGGKNLRNIEADQIKLSVLELQVRIKESRGKAKK